MPLFSKFQGRVYENGIKMGLHNVHKMAQKTPKISPQKSWTKWLGIHSISNCKYLLIKYLKFTSMGSKFVFMVLFYQNQSIFKLNRLTVWGVFHRKIAGIGNIALFSGGYM